MSKIIYCTHCNTILTGYQKKFCSRSCAAKVNNKLYPKRITPPRPPCSHCGNLVKWHRRKYCSFKCAGLAKRRPPFTEKELLRARTMQEVRCAVYRQKKYSQTPPDADMKLIYEIYKNRPEGYEVDHIIPISKGGLHHQDNLQYLTIHENRKKSNHI